MDKKAVLNDAHFEKIIDELKSICKKVGMEKDYIFYANKLSVAIDDDDDFKDTYSIQFTFKDYQYKLLKSFKTLQEQVSKTKYKDIVLIDPGYLPSIGDEFTAFDAFKQKVGLEAKITKKKSRIE